MPKGTKAVGGSDPTATIARLQSGDGKTLRAVHLSGQTVKSALLNRASLPSAELSDCTFDLGDLVEARVASSKLAHVRFHECSCQRLVLDASQLAEVVFERCDLEGASFARAVCRGLTLRDGSIAGAVFRNAVIERGLLVAVHCASADFSGARLAGFVARGCDFSGASFAGADLRGADLRDCDLVGVDFSRADLHGARFVGARYDSGTRWGGEAPTGVVLATARPRVSRDGVDGGATVGRAKRGTSTGVDVGATVGGGKRGASTGVDGGASVGRGERGASTGVDGGAPVGRGKRGVSAAGGKGVDGGASAGRAKRGVSADGGKDLNAGASLGRGKRASPPGGEGGASTRRGERGVPPVVVVPAPTVRDSKGKTSLCPCIDVTVYWTDPLGPVEHVLRFYRRARTLLGKEARFFRTETMRGHRPLRDDVDAQYEARLRASGPLPVMLDLHGGDERDSVSPWGYESSIIPVGGYARLMLPTEHADDPQRLVELTRELIGDLPFKLGGAGFAFQLDALDPPQEAVDAAYAWSMSHPGFDLPLQTGPLYAAQKDGGIKSIQWLTLVSAVDLERLGGQATLARKLGSAVTLHRLSHGVLVQAGERPLPGGDGDALPAYRSVALALRPIRTKTHPQNLMPTDVALETATEAWLARLD